MDLIYYFELLSTIIIRYIFSCLLTDVKACEFVMSTIIIMCVRKMCLCL